MFYGFDTEIAKTYGVNEAIMLQNFSFWIRKNMANRKNYHDGRYWTYNSNKAMAELFPFWSERQIRHLLDKLIAKGLLLKGNFNEQQYDRTLWYAFTDRGAALFDLDQQGDDSDTCIRQNCQMDLPKLSDDIRQICPIDLTKMSNGNDKNVEPIPYTNQIYNTDTDQIENTDTEPDTETEFPVDITAAGKLDYNGVKDYWNANCKGLPSVTVISRKRKETLRARIREHGLEALFTVMDKTAASWFLTGKNKTGWKASFDWVMRPENFVKVFEGNYDNPAPEAVLPENLKGALSNLEQQMLAEQQQGGCLF